MDGEDEVAITEADGEDEVATMEADGEDEVITQIATQCCMASVVKIAY